MELRRQALEEERRRREQVERRLQSESARRQQLVEKEVKMREKQFSQVRGRRGAWGGWLDGGAVEGWGCPVPLGSCSFSTRKDRCWLRTSRILLRLVQPAGAEACVCVCARVCVCISWLSWPSLPQTRQLQASPLPADGVTLTSGLPLGKRAVFVLGREPLSFFFTQKV